MTFNTTRKYCIAFPFIFLSIYIFTAAIPLGSDIYCKPAWIQPILSDTAETEQTGTPLQTPQNNGMTAVPLLGESPKPFITNNRFGYFTAEGKLLRSSPIINRISISAAAWSEYAENTVKTPVYHPDGSLLMYINEAGFVHIDEDRIYLFEPGGSAVKYYSVDGNLIWRCLHSAPITTFHSSEKGAIVGFSDGRLVCIDENGIVRFDFYPGGSNYQVILGAALSEDGLLAACVCGLEQQRVLLIRIDDNKHKIVYHRYLHGDLRRQVFVDFDKEGTSAVFECAEGMGFIDCKHLTSKIIPEKGSIVANGFYPYKNIMAVLAEREEKTCLALIECPMYLIGKTDFIAKNAFLMQEHDMLFIITDTHLARIDIKGHL